MNYFIFGGSGFIATHLSKYITDNVADKNIYKYDITKRVSDDYDVLDVREPINIQAPDLSQSIIFNLAAVHTTPGHPNHEYFETNILGAENICNFARQAGINTIVFTSSIAPYGPSEDLKEETTIPMPNSPYGISKLTAEYIHKVWQTEDPKNRRLIIVRPGVVFGKGENGNFTRLYGSLKKKMFFYPGRKDTLKAAVYVKDVARILYDASVDKTPVVETYNLSYFPPPSIEQICLAMAKETGVEKPKVVVPGNFLKAVAGSIYFAGRLAGKKLKGIHPDRVQKLMISTNISGKKLSESRYKLKYTLNEAIADWFNDCDKQGLY